MTFAFVTRTFAFLCIIVVTRPELSKSVAGEAGEAGKAGEAGEAGKAGEADIYNHTIIVPSGCSREGRWYSQGTVVSTRETCLRCTCYHGALSCRRRSCAPLPDPPPHNCHVVHTKGSCCAELHCLDGVKSMETTGVERLEDDLPDVPAAASLAHMCVQGDAVYTAGSAMSSSMACEQCFCLGATRKCVQPKCLSPPPGCRARPAPGACCPQKYYCEHTVTPPDERGHDCEVNGNWVSEGEKVQAANNNCTQCFCLRGAVRCQPLSCAPPLLGCKPLLRPGECCPHQYQCQHQQELFDNSFQPISSKVLPSNNEDRSFHIYKYDKHQTITKNIVTKKKNLTSSISDNNVVPTNKVKRKTNDPPPSSSRKPSNLTAITPLSTTKQIPDETTTEMTTEKITEQPEVTVKVMINGTINCTTEISSETIPVNQTLNDTNMIKIDVQPRIPIINIDSLDDHTFSPNDIITDRNVNGFDENDTFTINVTSSLTTNISRSTKPPMVTVSRIDLTSNLAGALNASKKTKGDYDYDYTEPTLPPSLPNLKIIPFVAADAVVDDEPEKDTLTYPMLEREDKFPVYYPSIDTKDTGYATRKADTYNPTQYPIFISNKEPQYPSLTNEDSLPISEYTNSNNDLEYSLSSSLGGRVPEVSKILTNSPAASSTFEVDGPIANLFSPPVETEGGFVPKTPGIINNYYALYPSTPPAASLPHLTTSMQLDLTRGECLSSDGRHVPEGESINFACSECICEWGELHCSPRSCHTPTGCRRRLASSSADLCCGELICDEDNKPTLSPSTTTDVKLRNDTKVKIENSSLTVKVNTSLENKLSNKNFTGIKPTIIRKVYNDTVEEKNRQTVTNNVSKESNASSVESLTIKNPHRVNTTVSTPAQTNNTLNNSQEYEDEEEDEGFSFGSVLKLLLSDNYGTTTLANQRTVTTNAPTKSTFKVTTRRPLKQTINPFIPLPSRPYISPNQAQTSISRIDHLVLGEATAIHTTVRPITKLTTTTKKTTTKSFEVTNKEQTGQHTSVAHEGPRPPSLGGLGAGLLKLAGCNIYGIMYRVGRIITELSTPCQECWCTELGVQCKPLKC